MLKPDSAEFWDKRYSEPAFVYGTEPNQFITELSAHYKPGMKALAVGDGEGRNGVWLAKQGIEVLSVDMSSKGLQKAQKLAKQNNVKIKTKCVDLTKWNWPKNQYDIVILIYVHFNANIRSEIHRKILDALKAGGLVICEAFNLDQIKFQKKYNSGGPKTTEMLYSTEILKQDFCGTKILILNEMDIELTEGEFHKGTAAIVRGIFQKL